MVEDNYRQIYSWAKILERIVANTTPDIAKKSADFCFFIIQYNIRSMQSDRAKTLLQKFTKILEYVKQVKSENVQNIPFTVKDNYELLFTWTEILESISENLDLDILDEFKSFCAVVIKASVAKMQSDQERMLARKFTEVIEKIELYNPYIICPTENKDIYDLTEKAHPPIPKIIHYCWLSNDPIPEKLQEYMKSWREKLPDYEFMLWNSDRFDIDMSLWVKQAFEANKYAFAADYIRLYAIYNHGGIYLDMDVEVVKPFDELLFTDCMIARDNNETIHLEAGCFGAVKGHPFIKQCLEFYRNRNFNPDKTGQYLISVVMGAILTACFKDTITVFPSDYFTAKSSFTGIITKTENTYAIHHFASSWLSPYMQLSQKKKWEYYQSWTSNTYSVFNDRHHEQSNECYIETSLRTVKSSRPGIHFIHRVDQTNTGDLACCPKHYYNEFFSLYNIYLHDIYYIRFNEIARGDIVILGGGGLFDCLEEWNQSINKLLDICDDVIGWSIGFNTHHGMDNNIKTNINFNKFRLLCIRDYNHTSGLSFLPCVSCKSSLLDKTMATVRNLGILRHKDVIMKHSFPGYDLVKNSASMKIMTDFIAESENIFSNTYHGALWSMWMGKPTVIDGFSTKFDFMNPAPVQCSGDIEFDLHNADKFPKTFLMDARKMNDDFFRKIQEILAAKNPDDVIVKYFKLNKDFLFPNYEFKY